MLRSTPFTFKTPSLAPVRFALEEDDPMWLVACSRDELISLLTHPYHWVESLNDQGTVPFKVELAEHFMMRVSIVNRPAPTPEALIEMANDAYHRSEALHASINTVSAAAQETRRRVEAVPAIAAASAAEVAELQSQTLRFRRDLVAETTHAHDQISRLRESLAGEKQFVVQGISGTGILMIRPLDNGAVMDESDWDDIWGEWMEDRTEMKVAFSRRFRQGFGHMELAPPGILASDRANRIAAFLMRAGNPHDKRAARNGAGEGLAHVNRMLRKKIALVQELNEQGKLEVVTDPDKMVTFKELTDTEIARATYTYVGRAGDFPRNDNNFITTEEACEDMGGLLELVHIRVDDIVIKAYRARE